MCNPQICKNIRLYGKTGRGDWFEKSNDCKEYQDKLLIEKGFKLGFELGRFEMALKVLDELGIDEAVRITGFSKEELETRKMNISSIK